jgi:hypothetical protein
MKGVSGKIRISLQVIEIEAKSLPKDLIRQHLQPASILSRGFAIDSFCLFSPFFLPFASLFPSPSLYLLLQISSGNYFWVLLCPFRAHNSVG